MSSNRMLGIRLKEEFERFFYEKIVCEITFVVPHTLRDLILTEKISKLHNFCNSIVDLKKLNLETNLFDLYKFSRNRHIHRFVEDDQDEREDKKGTIPLFLNFCPPREVECVIGIDRDFVNRMNTFILVPVELIKKGVTTTEAPFLSEVLAEFQPVNDAFILSLNREKIK